MSNLLNYELVENNFFTPFKKNQFKKVNNTSLVIIWKNPINKEIKYLIQKRSNKMKRGKNKLAVGGGMLEDNDETIQYGALREVLEESQLKLMKKKNLSIKTLRSLQKYLFPLKLDRNNLTFYMIIISKNQPKYFGPIDKKIGVFLNSKREVDTEDNKWNNKRLEGRIKYGHAFLSKREIIYHYNNDISIWKYSKKSLELLFKLFD